MDILWKGPIITIAFFLVVASISLTATPTKEIKKQEKEFKIFFIKDKDFKQETYHTFEWKEIK